ncbi:MAG TPA: 4'-phosphopantetheinyl transferase superfamily protein [Chitinophagaceae bacterium]|nr:4'-phosphopantetheinyl transferase superfamily protein [Chitinophagaceae bacterium]HPH32921.1 4'-phosphopantetheinyl transferase superfamily protein [Chitinophagaceae bacterium]HPN60236.1 4'-phosphopantetheinyl transferase superfamily protein [Chitinophagaceae bacterium]
MPVFFQQQINESTRLGVWKIEETEAFFRGNVPIHRDVTHPKKRLQHLAGRFLLQYLFPDFPYEQIRIADTRKPYLPDERYHFSISHCGDYAAAIVSRTHRVGVDVEETEDRILRIKDKFMSAKEQSLFIPDPFTPDYRLLTLLWSAKESVYKWYGAGEVDFRRHILLSELDVTDNKLRCDFGLTGDRLKVEFRFFDGLVLSWVVDRFTS